MAELNIEIQNRYPYLENLCKDYIANFGKADIVITVSEGEIADERLFVKSRKIDKIRYPIH